MRNLYYIPNLTRDKVAGYPILNIFGEKAVEILLEANNYPTIEHHDGYELFVILLPVYDPEMHHTIELIECNLLIWDENIIFVSNHDNAKIDKIIQETERHKINRSTLYTLIIQLCTYIIETIVTLEKVIEKMKRSTIEEQGYTSDTINTIMKLKLTIGMFRSTIEPLTWVINHIFDTISYKNCTLKDTQYNQIDYLIKQISAQSNFLYENISIVADTSNAISNININNIMKILTIISSIFIPLSFVTGVFGMNFTNMPWLHNIQRYYVTMWGMFFIWLLQLYAFKQKKWF